MTTSYDYLLARLDEWDLCSLCDAETGDCTCPTRDPRGDISAAAQAIRELITDLRAAMDTIKERA